MTFTWLNPPPRWSAGSDTLTLTTGEATDFWQRTHYGFTRDSGHAWLAPVDGDFTAEVRFRGGYTTLYDQAGLMLRRDAETWIKAGIEFTDGLMHFSVVVTADGSDWSVIPLPDAAPDTWISVRMTRRGAAVLVQCAVEDSPWRMARLAPFPAEPARAGPMACSPERGGLEVEFSGLRIGPAVDAPLHAG